MPAHRAQIIQRPPIERVRQGQFQFPFNDGQPQGNYVDTMELETAAIMRPVYQSPVFRSRFGAGDGTTSTRADSCCHTVADLARKFQSGRPVRNSSGKYELDGTSYDTQIAAIIAEFDSRTAYITGLTGTEKNYAWNLFYNVVARGVTSFLEYNSVFRRTITAGDPSAVVAVFTGAGKIWTTAEVVTFEAIPNDGWFILPTAQWHKDTPRVLSVYGQKTQITYCYTEIKTASGLLYEAYGAATLIDL